MQSPRAWIWEHPNWPEFRFDAARLSATLARARLAQGEVLGAIRMLDERLSVEAAASVLVENGVTTSAIEGERLDPDAVRSSVARHLGLPTDGLRVPTRASTA